ncbi:MAG: hypothetical protein ACI88H_003374 [Cocleimonas sp.]|jgi:hypothetical protein
MSNYPQEITTMRRTKTIKHSALVILLMLTSFWVSNAFSASTGDIRTAEKSGLDALVTILSSRDAAQVDSALASLDKHWRPKFIPQVLETIAYTSNQRSSSKTIELLHRKTAKSFGTDFNQWYYWLWNRPENLSANYANFKAALYRNIDPKFETYFRNRQDSARVRLDEIRWGGVAQDGIPPLRNPAMISASRAGYLQDNNVVFGIKINGDARAYPKRILAWHEMFVDTIGGVDIAGVYCTLCGTVIPYKTKLNGVDYNLGTSGFLYRSNKLMYDQKTQSLWNTIKGEPVLGPLVDKGIKLEHLSVVTTSWGEWKRRHPKTTVLSEKTGHIRNYGEGVAYKNYFGNDALMFNTPFSDKRLKNKQEVLALRFPSAPKNQLAIDTAFLEKNPLYKNKIGAQKLLILTDKSGANRVYDPENINFVSYDQDSTLVDDKGIKWTLTESELVAQNNQRRLNNLPYHRAFWFGWHATYPQTRLIK